MTQAATNKWLSLTGWLLIASGVFHIFVWLVIGGEWEGAVSWRKPILFGISAGMTVLSFSWIYGKLPTRRYDWLLLPGFSLSMLVEVALITLQQWRGVPSHFNRATEFDASVETWITLLIIIASIAIADLSIRSFGPLSESKDTALAVRSGVVFLLISIGIGFVISFYGQHLAEQNLDPSIYGDDGVMKFPHGIAIHAIQLFPAILVLLRRKGLAENRRAEVLLSAIFAMGFLLTFSLFQTLNGVGRIHPTIVGGVLLACAGLSIGIGLYLTFANQAPAKHIA
jgi:hypothetical protein